MSQFYSTKMDASEDCASFGIRLEQKLNQVTLQYPDKISTEIYWNHVKDRFFHGLSPIMKAKSCAIGVKTLFLKRKLVTK